MSRSSGFIGISALVFSLLLASSVGLASYIGFKIGVPNFSTTELKGEKVANSFLDIEPKKIIHKINEALSQNNYELADSLYKERFENSDFELGSKLAEDLKHIRNNVLYYRKYLQAKSIVATEGAKNWEQVRSILEGMPENFYYNAEVTELTNLATKILSATPSPKNNNVAGAQIRQIDSDPPVHCQIAPECGGGTKPLKKSECDSVTCCLLKEGAKLLPSKSACTNYYTGGGSAPSTKFTYQFDCSVGDQKIKMTDMNACINAMNAYWLAKGQPQKVIPTTQPTSVSTTTTTTKIDNSAACRNQYNIEVQNANFLSGGARDGAISIATQSLNRCLASGNVEVNKLVIPPAPTTAVSGMKTTDTNAGANTVWDMNPF